MCVRCVSDRTLDLVSELRLFASSAKASPQNSKLSAHGFKSLRKRTTAHGAIPPVSRLTVPRRADRRISAGLLPPRPRYWLSPWQPLLMPHLILRRASDPGVGLS
jgi:hypothetical protein